MNKLILVAFMAGALISTKVFSTPITLPDGPIFFDYLTAEQNSKTNDINNSLNPAAVGNAPEGNWGIMQVTTLSVGTVLSPTGSQIGGPGSTIFSSGQNGGQQILGIFYGILNNSGGPPDNSMGGFLDLYFWDTNNQTITTPFGITDLANRGQGGSQSANSEGAYLGFTCPPNTAGCTFLVRFDFTPGADINSQINTIIAPGGSTFESYLSVDTSTVGSWTDTLNSDFFTLNPINQTCGAVGVSCTSPNDMRTDGTFTRNGAGAWDVTNSDIIGLGKNASSRASVVPEPSSIILFSLGLAVAARLRRREICCIKVSCRRLLQI